MAGHTYEQIVVHGGNVVVGDYVQQHVHQHLGNYYPVEAQAQADLFFAFDNASSSIDLRSLSYDLAVTARYCETIGTNIASVDGSWTSLRELSCDVVDLESALSTIQILLEDPDVTQSTPGVGYDSLLDLVSLMGTYKEMVAAIGRETHDWATLDAGRDKDALRPTPAEAFDVRQRLASLRRKLNLTVSIVNW